MFGILHSRSVRLFIFWNLHLVFGVCVIIIVCVIGGVLLTLSPLFLGVLLYFTGSWASKMDRSLMCRVFITMFILVFPLSIRRATRTRALAMIKTLEPDRFIRILLDLVVVVRSGFWDGRQVGPDFISPRSSLAKRQSGHLAKLLLEYSTRLSKFESRNADTVHQDCGPRTATEVPSRDNLSAKTSSDANSDSVDQQVFPQAVVILDVDEVAPNGVIPGEVLHRRLESQCTTLADVDLMALVPILLSLLIILRTRQWDFALAFIASSFFVAFAIGPGTLVLSRKAAVHPAELYSGDGCAVLLDDNLTVMIHGSHRIVEAITEGGFHLLFPESQHQPPEEDGTQIIIPITGRGNAIFLLPFVTLALVFAVDSKSAPFHNSNFVVIGFMIVFRRELFRTFINDSLAPPLQSLARLSAKFLIPLFVVTFLVLASPMTILVYGPLFFTQAFPDLFGRPILHSYYPVRIERCLDALGRPPIRKWPFLTRASAAAFVCLVLCQDIPRPVKSIDVLGVLDTLIPDQRDIWRVWKERVADRIVHEESINFAPTIPTFPGECQQLLKRLLDEAQVGYDTYLSLPPRQGKRRSHIQEAGSNHISDIMSMV